MCGILCLLDSPEAPSTLRSTCLKCSKLLRHRGPDWSGLYFYQAPSKNSFFLAHERLGIVCPESGAQPLVFSPLEQAAKEEEKSSLENGFYAKQPGAMALTVNGEIYNHNEIREEFKDFPYQTLSDCEVILPLFQKHGVKMMSMLDGMFAFVLMVVQDDLSVKYFAARDHMGICPLYIGYRADGAIMFSSELKAIHSQCPSFEIFPPGHYYDSSLPEGEKFVRYYDPSWRTAPNNIGLSEEQLLPMVKSAFEKAVQKRMMSDVPWGVLLSGGLDSSLVASVAVKFKNKMPNYPAIHSFSIGLKGSPDLEAAKKVSDFLGTQHHEFVFTVQEGLDVLHEVIYHLETYDVTTIRASTPMYLMARKIKALGVKMVLSGEGADECLAGYLYFHKAPDGKALHEETVRKLDNLHYYDCLRANKAMSSFGVEPRVPFLDKEFLDLVMNMNPDLKIPRNNAKKIEKYILRKAFDETKEYKYLPAEVLWRQKEQFSDGVGYSWIDGLRDNGAAKVSDSQFKNRAKRFPVNTPQTKEAYVYREMFENAFPSESARNTVPSGPSIACSTPAAIEWDEEFKRLASGVGGDNSGRAVKGVHESAYDDVMKTVKGE
eukprot:snap_masked-scaffold_2-processed-gene-1.33-mRNA-1 protein AED:0.01 eAED:0.01 QI:0/-1/0/1/-1/1/1/0/602